MFTKNSYLLPQVSSPLHPRAAYASAVDHLNGVEILLHHHHPDMFSGHYFAANAPVLEAAATSFLNQDNGGGERNGDDPSSMANTSLFQKKQTAAKKDRHSKIFTSQGPRDRRVRLSIGIARKFFDLQEMLGFDKPSKTLDWLLTKSKAAIKELVQSKNSSSPSACELFSSEGINGEFLGVDSKRKSGKGEANDLAKESRAKARARARERTREKMSIKQRNNHQLEVLQSSAAAGYSVGNNNLLGLKANNNNAGIRHEQPIVHCPLTYEAGMGDDLVEESIVIKRKLMKNNPSSFFGFQQNVIVSRDLSSNYNVPSANTTENWDICSFTSQSNLCAILDQHKFINSTSNT